jgi:hypothetical protein
LPKDGIGGNTYKTYMYFIKYMVEEDGREGEKVLV